MGDSGLFGDLSSVVVSALIQGSWNLDIGMVALLFYPSETSLNICCRWRIGTSHGFSLPFRDDDRES